LPFLPRRFSVPAAPPFSKKSVFLPRDRSLRHTGGGRSGACGAITGPQCAHACGDRLIRTKRLDMNLRERLFELAEPDYRAFSAPLLPGTEHILGVRLPLLRRLAREIARGDWRAWLAQTEAFYFEERMLRGMVISYARCAPEEKLRHTARFVPTIDNWAVCDSFCWRLKAAEREPMWRFIRPRFRAAAEYEVRFAAVMALRNFVDEEHLEPLFRLLGEVRHEGYYARMGVAWAVSVCCVKSPERTRCWLTADCPLDDWTFDKSLQKIAESHRIGDADKCALRALRRPAEKRRARGEFAK